MTLWVRWKKPVKLAIALDPEDVEGVQDIGGNTSDKYIRVEMPFNSMMTEFFEGSDINNLIQLMFASIKTQFFIIFFTKRFYRYKKAQNRLQRKKIKNLYKKHLRGKKVTYSLIYDLCFCLVV